MENPGDNFADEAGDMASENAMSLNTELRKRRSTRIVQAVPLAVTGVDALGRQFTERTSTLIINCHGCRYQSKHYVLKNMWVTLEIPHPESGHAARAVRGRVAWIQRPRTVRQLFQVALELEQPGNAWGMAFPPEDWFGFPEAGEAQSGASGPGGHAGAEGIAGASGVQDVTESHAGRAASGAEVVSGELHLPLSEADLPPAIGSDNVRIFPSPASMTDASLQLARQMTRLLNDAKQQIHTAARDAATQAVSSERHAAFEQWEQKFAAARVEVANEATRAIDKLQQNADEQVKKVAATAAELAEKTRVELPASLAPRLEEFVRELTHELAQEAAAQRAHFERQAAAGAETLQTLRQQTEDAANKLAALRESAEAQLQERAETAAKLNEDAQRAMDEMARVAEEAAKYSQATLAEVKSAQAAALEQQGSMHAAMEAAWRTELSQEMDAARERWQAVVDGMITEATAAAQEHARQGLEGHARGLSEQIAQQVTQQVREQLTGQLAEAGTRQVEMHVAALHETAARVTSELEQQVAGLRDAAGQAVHGALSGALHDAAKLAVTNAVDSAVENAVNSAVDRVQGEAEQRVAGLRESLGGLLDGPVKEQAARLEELVSRAGEAIGRMEQFSSQLGAAQEDSLRGFRAQLDEALALQGNELQRRSESLFEEINARIRDAFEGASRLAVQQFEEQVTATVQPHVTRAEEAVHRMAGGRSLLDAAMTLQQERIRSFADESFAESLGRFRENLGTVEEVLADASRTITEQSLGELETKVQEVKLQAIEDVFKSSEWYEKKAQTHIQNTTEKVVEQVANQLREKAGEVSSSFASEVDHASRNFVGHTQSQIEEVLRDAFERSRGLFAEAAETTAAAFTDEIQRTARQELAGFGDEVQRAAAEMHGHMESARMELALRTTAEQEDFLRRFQAGMNRAMETSLAEAHKSVEASFAPLLESVRTMTAAHQEEARGIFKRAGEQAAEEHREKLHGISNQWMLATVATLDQQARGVVSNIAASAEQQLQAACEQVFAGIGETLRERLQQIASGIATKAKGQSA